MLNSIQDSLSTVAIAAGSTLLGVAVDQTTQVPIGVAVGVGLFIVGFAVKQARWQKGVDDNFKAVETNFKTILDHHARMTENQKLVWEHIDKLNGVKNSKPQTDVIDHPEA